jgi:hypothetical protein
MGLPSTEYNTSSNMSSAEPGCKLNLAARSSLAGKA